MKKIKAYIPLFVIVVAMIGQTGLVEQIVSERSSSAIQDSLEKFLNAPSPVAKRKSKARTKTKAVSRTGGRS